MSSSSTKKMIVLMTSDEQSFEVEESVAMESQTIKHMIEDVGSDEAIPLPNVTSNILAKVIEYCNRHASSNKPSSSDKQEGGTTSGGGSSSSADADLKAFNTEFVKVDQKTLFDLILAANYLDIKSLLDLTCQTVADMIKDKQPKEIRKIFNIKNDFTPEEEEEIRRENAWAFQ